MLVVADKFLFSRHDMLKIVLRAPVFGKKWSMLISWKDDVIRCSFADGASVDALTDIVLTEIRFISAMCVVELYISVSACDVPRLEFS